MAIGNNSSSTFLKISNGKVVRTYKNPTEHSVARVNKNGATVHEESYDYVEGYITNITTKENDYGKFWVVNLQDGDENYQLEFNYSGGTASSFLKALPNVNLAELVRLSPKQQTDGDKTRNTLFINQNGKAVKWFWTKDNPGELPQLEKIKVKGKETWDDSSQMSFLEEFVKDLMKNHATAGALSSVPEEDDF